MQITTVMQVPRVLLCEMLICWSLCKFVSCCQWFNENAASIFWVTEFWSGGCLKCLGRGKE